MSLCLSMIVKNEAHVIQRCLRSVRPFINSYSISDTGSTDNTTELIRQELAGLPGVLQSDAWQDFATNRNLALSRCTGDYILTMDADETLEADRIIDHPDPTAGAGLPLSDEYDGFLIRDVLPGQYFWQLRIVRNLPGWHWSGKIHETLAFSGGRISETIEDFTDPNHFKKIENFTVTGHFDSHRNQLGDKLVRDLAILESEPPTHRNVFYHAQTLWLLGRSEEAIKKYYERAEMGGWEEEVYYSLLNAANLQQHLGRSFDEVAGAFYRAYIYRPSRLEALVALCRMLRERQRWDESYRLSLVEPEPTQDRLFVDPNATWMILEEHGLAAYYLDRKEEARKYFLRAAEHDLGEEDRARTIRNIGFCVV